MDEKSIEHAGTDPLRPALNQIASLQSTRDIARFIGQEHLNGNTHTMLFGFGSGQDYDNSSQEMAFAEAGGLGLPDRDYYTKTDAKSGRNARPLCRTCGKDADAVGRIGQPSENRRRCRHANRDRSRQGLPDSRGSSEPEE